MRIKQTQGDLCDQAEQLSEIKYTTLLKKYIALFFAKTW